MRAIRWPPKIIVSSACLCHGQHQYLIGTWRSLTANPGPGQRLPAGGEPDGPIGSSWQM